MKKNNKMINYTIFGSSGFLGKNFKNYFKKKNINFFCPPKTKYKFRNNLGNVFYCAGTSESISNPEKALKANLVHLSNIILNNKFKSFTYFSSIRVYSSEKKTEEKKNIISNFSEKGIYFKSLKLAAESLCLQLDNPKIRIIRLSNLYGNYFGKQIYLMPTILRNIKNGKKIVLTINANSTKNYLHVNDAINISIKIALGGKYRIYNVASKSKVNIKKIFEIIKKFKKINVKFLGQKKVIHEPKIDIRRIKNEFNFNEKNNFTNNFSELVKNYFRLK